MNMYVPVGKASSLRAWRMGVGCWMTRVGRGAASPTSSTSTYSRYGVWNGQGNQLRPTFTFYT